MSALAMFASPIRPVVVLQAPRVPVQAEDLEMQKLINTYGKTFHTWQVDRGDVLPFGKPALATVPCVPEPLPPSPLSFSPQPVCIHAFQLVAIQ